MTHDPSQADSIPHPRIIAFEVTRRCPLRCRHCRAAGAKNTPDGLTTNQCRRILEGIADFHKPIIIFTGGEPLARADIFELIASARSMTLPAVLATCGLDLDADTALKLKESGISAISFSIDGASAQTHDDFRQTPGAYDSVMSAIEAVTSAGLRFQINTTITRMNVSEVDAIARLAVERGAVCFNPFILVPVGRGDAIRDWLLGPREYEDLLNRLADLRRESPIEIRVTCGPQFARVARRKKIPGAEMIPGCLAATGFAFISHTGDVQTCGFLDQSAGNLMEYDYDFGRLWRESPLLVSLRGNEFLGACGDCAYRTVCRGCRARALAVTGDVLHEDPICVLAHNRPERPSVERLAPSRPIDGHDGAWASVMGGSHPDTSESLDDFQKRLLTILQNPLPICRRPFRRLAEILRSDESAVLEETIAFKSAGWIRRFRGQINYRALGRTAVLVAACVPEDRLHAVGRAICQRPDVSHNYVRRHRFNLWFTLQGTSESDIDRQLADLSFQTDVVFHSLPALRWFKLDVRFPLIDSPELKSEATECLDLESTTTGTLSCLQQTVLTAVQRELPLVVRPFDSLADVDPEIVIKTLNSLQSLGVLRRISAVVDYRRLGFVANTMFAASVPDDQIVPAGLDLARCPWVSHCYHRRLLPELGYNLFAMLHARTASEISHAVKSFAAKWNLSDYALLDTVAELKKQPVMYPTI